MRMFRTTRANSARGSSAFRLASPSAIHEAPVALSPSKPAAQSRNSRQARASSVVKPASYHSCVTSGVVSGAPVKLTAHTSAASTAAANTAAALACRFSAMRVMRSLRLLLPLVMVVAPSSGFCGLSHTGTSVSSVLP